MSASRFQSSTDAPQTPTANSAQKSTARAQRDLFDTPKTLLPGSLNDSALVRGVLIQAIKKSGKSRAQLAEDITFLAGRDVTEISLNKFTAESRTDYRWPAELDRAFCAATGDYTLLRCRAELAGFRVVTDTEYDMLRLGREYLRQKRANENVALLEARLAGVDL